MNNTQWLVCRAFIDKKGSKESLLPFLSHEQQKIFSSLPLCSKDLSLGFDQVKHLLHWTHYSWFAPFLRTLSENEIPFFLSTFPEDKTKQLSDYLLFSSPAISISPPLKTFLQKKIIDVLLADNPTLPPIEGLPTSPLHCLLELSPAQFSIFIDFLGLYDLAIEMRLIIDTVKIKKIQSILSKEKMIFLSLLSNRQEPQLFKRIDRNLCDGKIENLPNLLHKKGMNRLAKALYPEDPDFIYYIKLRMSSDEFAVFLPLHKKSENAKTYKILIGQIMDVLTFFKKNNIQASL